MDCSEPRQLFPDCSPLNCSEVNWGVFDAKADLLLPGVEGIFRYTSNSSDGQQVYKTDVGDTAKIRKDPNRKLVGSVEMGQRSFLIDSSFTDTWVESIDCEVNHSKSIPLQSQNKLCRSALGVNGAPAPSPATGAILGKAGGEGMSPLSPHTVEHLVQFLVKTEPATISPAQLTVR